MQLQHFSSKLLCRALTAPQLTIARAIRIFGASVLTH